MDKILVTIYVLSIEQEFDVFLPIGETVSNVLDLIQDSLVDLSNNNYIKKENVYIVLKNDTLYSIFWTKKW